MKNVEIIIITEWMYETYEKETCGYGKVEWRYERFREMWKYGDMRK